jgi:hypothetical protein
MAKDVPMPGEAEADRRRRIAENLERLQRKVLKEFRKVVQKGFARQCPLCGHEGQFAPAGMPPRLDSQCPSCDSRERHRLFKLWLDRGQRITKAHKVLHFAPEPEFSKLFRQLAGEYVTADLRPRRVDLALNIETLDLPDASFDVIIAHQIMEHVDHRKALAECFRCLRPDGFLILTTPIIEAWEHTYENSDAKSEAQRFLHHGQRDHVRYFGRDIRDDMTAAGFTREEVVSVEPDVSRYGLVRGETLFILTKPGKAAARATTRKKKV